MDRTVPPGAAILLGFIYKTETGRDGDDAYKTLFAHSDKHLAKPITEWTLDEVEADGPRRTRAFGSSAAGAGQFMRDTLDKPGTLQDIEGEMGLTGRELFSPDLQDRMAFHLLKRRGYQAFVSGRISATDFGKRLAQEWASFPVLAATKGQKRDVVRGQSYYAGDGLNKSLVTPEAVEEVLARVLAISIAEQAPVPFPPPPDIPAADLDAPEPVVAPVGNWQPVAWAFGLIAVTAAIVVYFIINRS